VARKAIAHIDLLGVRKLWKEGGVSSVRNRINEFSELITQQLAYLPSEVHRDNEYTIILSGDSASIICQDAGQAIGIVSHLFMQAFYATDRVTRPLWLRGSISHWHNQRLPTNSGPISANNVQVGTRYKFEEDFLRAIALEKSGFRGMRLIVDRALAQPAIEQFQAHWDDFTRPLKRIITLEEFEYPQGGPYCDVLWMIGNEEQYNTLKGIMASRFKKCTADPDEFAQAAWTRAVFDQVDSLIWMCRQQDRRWVTMPRLNEAGEPPSADHEINSVADESSH